MDQSTVLWIVGAVFACGILYAQVYRARTDIDKLSEHLDDIRQEISAMGRDIARMANQR